MEQDRVVVHLVLKETLLLFQQYHQPVVDNLEAVVVQVVEVMGALLIIQVEQVILLQLVLLKALMVEQVQLLIQIILLVAVVEP